GFLIEPNNINDLVDKINLLLNSEEVKKVGAKGRKIVESKYNKEKIDKIFIKVFENIL
ncbi:MAG: glycosyltransferase family 1 protein, partial [Xanthomonadaceae bacterium]|nr:glycosyltransferase family 1 protein [Rhodospirillaceae bacterium]NIA17919.1 glycosyltransferase family 1 protein [Xanthomonadaceae bacterium]